MKRVKNRRNIILYDDKKELLKYTKGLNNIDGYYASANNSINLIKEIERGKSL